MVALTVRRMGGEPSWRVVVLAALRLAAFACLLVAVVGLPRVLTREAVLPGELVVAVDSSQSMSLPAETGGGTRLEAARRALDAVKELSVAPTAPRVTVASVADGPMGAVPATGPVAAAERTDLRGALREMAVRHAPVDAVLISDGADTRGARAAELSAVVEAAALRLTAVPVGEPRTPRDLSVGLLSAPRVVRSGSEFELSGTIRSTGYGDGPVTGRVLRDGQVVGSVNGAVRAGAAAVKVPLTAGAPGRYRYSLRLPPRDDEVTAANNSRSVLVRVVPDKPEVVLVGGAPSMEYAATKRVLLADRSLRTRVYVRKTTPAGFWRDDGTPRPAEAGALGDLGKTNALILQDVPAAALGSVAGSVGAFVRSGGGLLVAVGDTSAGGYAGSAVGDALPGSIGAYVDELAAVRPADGGDSLSEALRQTGIPFPSLPAIRGRALLNPKQGAQVALVAGGAPLLVSWQVGRGRVALLGTDGLHRWVFGPRGGEENERALAALWGTIVDRLTEVRDDRPVVAEFEREQYPVGTPARLLVQVTDPRFRPVSDAQVVAQVRPEGAEHVCASLDDGRYEATIPTPGPGALQVTVTASAGGRRLGDDEASTDLIPAIAELVNSRPNPELLGRVAEASGGRAVGPSEVAAEARSLVPRPSAVRRSTVVDRSRGALMLSLVVLIWTVDWSLRRRWYGR